jgi:hypothetical protein
MPTGLIGSGSARGGRALMGSRRWCGVSGWREELVLQASNTDRPLSRRRHRPVRHSQADARPVARNGVANWSTRHDQMGVAGFHLSDGSALPRLREYITVPYLPDMTAPAVSAWGCGVDLRQGSPGRLRSTSPSDERRPGSAATGS